MRCEKVAAHRERILFQLYSSTALRNVGRKSFSNRNFPECGIVTRVLFLKILGQRVFSHVRIYTENTFLFNQYFHNFLGKFRCRNFSTRKIGNPCPPLIQKIPVLEFLSFIYWTPLSSCNMREISVCRNTQLPFS